MASIQDRRRTTSILQYQGPSNAKSEAVVQHELVPLKHELVGASHLQTASSTADVLHTIQRNVDDATRACRSLPHLGGTYWPKVSFLANSPVVFRHGLQGEVAWQIARQRSAAGIWETAQDVANGRVTLVADHATTADVHFFPQPDAK